MKKCCECKKIVWPWSQSKISITPIHKKCHGVVLREAIIENPEMYTAFISEIVSFKRDTGINSGLRIGGKQ